MSVIDAHLQRVRSLAKPGQPLGVGAANATPTNPAWFRNGDVRDPRSGRRELHTRLIAEHRARHPQVIEGRQALVLAGPPGAGKSSVKAAVLGARLEQYLPIDADDFKHALLQVAIEDGSYESVLKPDVVRELEAAGERFFPLELSALVHEESSLLAARARAEAIERGDNVIIDTVLSGRDSALRTGALLETNGYVVDVVDVEVPYELSIARVASRWRDAYAAALDGRADALGGRWVPSEYTRGIYDDAGGSLPRANAAELATRCTAVRSLRVFEATAHQPEPRQVLHQVRRTPDGPLLDAGAVAGADLARKVTPSVARVHRPQPDRDRGHER